MGEIPVELLKEKNLAGLVKQTGKSNACRQKASFKITGSQI
jgi:hypothetical protein